MRRAGVFVVVMAMVAAACTTSNEAVESTTTSIGQPPPLAQPPSPPQIIPLLRTTSDSGSNFGQKVFFSSKVLSAEPITRLELLVNGEMVDDVDFEKPIADPPFTWEWIPGTVGLQAAVVRAFDQSGRVVDSFPTWFRIGPGTDAVTGESRDALPVSPLSTGSPEVSTDTTTCEATFEVVPAADQIGQHVVASTIGIAGSEPIAVLPPQGGQVSIPVSASPALVSVSSYDETLAQPVQQFIVPGAPECADGKWEGDVSLDGSVLVGGEGLDAAYLYITEDDSSWRRLPETGFVMRGSDGFDFTGLIPAVPSGGHLEVEVWGRKGGGLEALGRGRYNVAPAGSGEAVWGGSVKAVQPFSSLNIVRTFQIVDSGGSSESLLLEDVVCGGTFFNPDCAPNPSVVRWNSGYTGAKSGLVQIFSSPPPTGPALDSPGLLWSAEFALDGEIGRDVDLSLQDIVTGSWLSDTARSGGPAPTEFTTFGYTEFASMEADLSQIAPAAPGVSPRVSQPVLGSFYQGVIPDRIWVRVVPISESGPIPGTSNTVSFRVEHDGLSVTPNAQQVFDSYFDTKIEVTQPKKGNDTFARCVRVVENPFGKENPVPDIPPWNVFGTATWQPEFDVFRDWAGVWTAEGKQATGLVPGATVCARHPDPPDDDLFDYLSDAISFIGDVWDTFKNMVDMIKAGIIEGIVDIVGCEPKATCVTALTALADAGLAAIGVPPSLPSFNDFVEAAKGDIAGALAKQLVGQACGEIPCEKFAEQFVNDALDDIQEHFSEMAVSNTNTGGWELILNPEIIVVPEPAGTLFPGSVKVTFTRKEFSSTAAPPDYCPVSLITEGSGFVDWTEKGGKFHEDGAVNGTVFAKETTSVSLAELLPGESISVGVSGLDFDRIAHLPGTEPHKVGFVSQEKLKSLALFSDPDTTLTMIVDVCGKEFKETAKLSGAGTNPAEIPSS